MVPYPSENIPHNGPKTSQDVPSRKRTDIFFWLVTNTKFSKHGETTHDGPKNTLKQPQREGNMSYIFFSLSDRVTARVSHEEIP